MTALHLHRFGSGGAPVLAIHGITAHGRRFERLAREAMADRLVLAPDLRGHGRSTWDPPWGTAQHVDDLLDTLDGAGADSVDIVGHSYGGLLATLLAQRAPARVRRICLLDPAIGVDVELAREGADAARQELSWATLDEARAARASGLPESAVRHAHEDVAEHVEQGADGRYRRRLEPSAEVVGWSETARPPVSDLQTPTLLVTASQAGLVNDRLRQSLLSALGSRYSEVTVESGHMLYWEAFDETAGHVRRFLAG